MWGVHGVGGVLGIVLLGVFASAFNPAGADGLARRQRAFFVKQTAPVVGSSVWAFAFTYGMLWLIDRVTPVKVTERRGGRARHRAPWRDRVSRRLRQFVSVIPAKAGMTMERMS